MLGILCVLSRDLVPDYRVFQKEFMLREFLNRNEEQEVLEAKRIAPSKAWYGTIDKRDPKTSEPVKPLTRKEIHPLRRK